MRAHGRHVKAHAGCARCMGSGDDADDAKESERCLPVWTRFSNRCLDARSGRGRWVITRSCCWLAEERQRTRLAWHFGSRSHPLAQLREHHGAVVYSKETGRREGETVYRAHIHTHTHQEATGMRLLRQRAAELSSPPPPARSNRGRSFAQGLDARNLLLLLECTGAIMSSHCTTHDPPSCACMCPSARNAVRLAVSALAVRVCCRCLCFPISSHLLCPLREVEEQQRSQAERRRWRTIIIPRLLARLAPPLLYTL